MISMRSMVSMSRVHVAHANALLVQIFGEVFRHAFCQHGDQRAIAGLRGGADFADEIVDLRARGADVDRRIDQAGRADHLLDEHAAAFVQLPAARRRRHRDRLRAHHVPFLEPQRTVVHAGGQAEAVFGQRRLAAEVAAEHAADLRHGDVAFVGEHQRVVGHVFEQRRRRLAGAAAGEVARIVLDAGAASGRFHHFEIEGGALLQPLRFQQAALVVELVEPQLQFALDRLDRLHQRRARRHIVRVGVDLDEFEIVLLVAGERIELLDIFHGVAEQVHAPGAVLIVRREDVDDVAAHAKGAAGEIGLGALVLQRDEVGDQLPLVDALALLQRKGHRGVGLDRADTVDAGHRGDDDDVVALQQRARRRMAHAVDLLVDRRVLLDVGVGARHVGFGLVVVVIADEILHRVVGEEALELAIELRGQRLVRRQDDGGALRRLDHLGHGVGLARAGDAEQHLGAVVAVDALDQFLDRGRLVALRLVFGLDHEAHAAFGFFRARRPVRRPDSSPGRRRP